ncbi:hypothetical protein CICLE_v100236471mg, partial [Citrus x clementina]
KDPVGVESRIKEIEALLGTGSTDVYKLGIWIWGIGGIGKTTIAGAIFNKISRHFEGSYFAHNVRDADQTGRLPHLRQELLSALLGGENVKNIPNTGLNFQSKRLTRRKVLIVFDDVNHLRQIEFLIGHLDWFASGSRIIITTRDKRVLSSCWVNQIYQVKELGGVDALKLFSRFSFGRDHLDASYVEPTKKIVKYAQGVPLVLWEWESAIRKLENVPHIEIQAAIKISFDGLDDHEQNIFLDIACFLKEERRDQVLSFLDACGFFAEMGLRVLIDKSLITISHSNTITMHDLLQDMGREIIRKESIHYPGERSRLWHHKDIYEVLTKNMGTEKIEGICLDMSKMRKLRFLKFYSSSINGENKCKISDFQGPEFAELRYLHWHGYPLKSLPSNIHLEKLVLLEMPRSNIQQLRKGLVMLDLSGCKSLKSLPAEISNLESLKKLNLSGCSKLKRLPEFSSAGNIEELWLDGTAIEELPPSIVELDLEKNNFKSMPESIIQLSNLKYLNISYCERLQSLSKLPCNLEWI